MEEGSFWKIGGIGLNKSKPDSHRKALSPDFNFFREYGSDKSSKNIIYFSSNEKWILNLRYQKAI